MLGHLSADQIDHILHSQLIGRIGCYAQEKVYVVPVTFVYKDSYIYAHSMVGLKIEMMRKNPNVCFQIDVIDNMTNWRSVIVWGKYEEFKTDEDQKAAIKILLDKLGPYSLSETVKPSHGHPPQTVEKGKKAILYTIKIIEKTGRFEKS